MKFVVLLFLAWTWFDSGSLGAASSSSSSERNNNFNSSNSVHLNSCRQCVSVTDHEEARRLKMEAVKNQILSKLQLQERPNMTNPLPRNVLLQVLQHTYNHDLAEDSLQDQSIPDDIDGMSEEKDNYYGRVSEIVVFSEPGGRINDYVLLDFFHPVHRSPQRIRVTAAFLWVQLRANPSLTQLELAALVNSSLTLYVFRVDEPPNGTMNALKYSLLALKRIESSPVGWQRLDLYQEVQEWFRASKTTKFTLLVDCNGCNSSIEPVLFSGVVGVEGTNKSSEAGVRVFSIKTETIPQRRSLRFTKTCKAHVTNCCMQSLLISFKKLGWEDWIIAPKGYQANYCMGRCGRSPRTPDTYPDYWYYSQVMDEHRRKNPFASITPCCAPTKLASLSIIYVDKDMNIFQSTLPNMRVEECGCT
ncbi:LOW QUALITY PROTEIN: inhibin beta B chain-like [Tachypleus tridentatus]|uniref:LOW QUALITY PROTEIN: inhibin beta B chain-like n=1 Tax=Tachypleus tridentatus TaxID=6853 RepID=UPI003FD3BD2F